MDKLSSILPSSPRVQSVDLTEAPPRRPGSPAFGMPMGSTSSVRDRFTSTARTAMQEQQSVYQNPKDTKSAKIVNDISRGFFEKRLSAPTEEGQSLSNPNLVSQMAVEEMADALAQKPASIEPPQFMVRPTSPSATAGASPVAEPVMRPESVPGRHIDLMA